MSLERMDDLFGVTELVKQLDDEERAQSTSANEKERLRDKPDHIEITESK